MTPDDQLCKIASVWDTIDAAMISGALADANIWSSQSGEFTAGFATPVRSPITIFVHKTDAEEVRDIVRQLNLQHSLCDAPSESPSSSAGTNFWTEVTTQTKDSYSLMKRRMLQFARSERIPKFRSFLRFRTRTLLLLQTIFGVILFALAGKQSTVFSVFFYAAACIALGTGAIATVWAATNTTKVREEWRSIGQVMIPIVAIFALVCLVIKFFT